MINLIDMDNTATNDITGDTIKTKPSGEAYRAGHERIWGSRSGRTAPNVVVCCGARWDGNRIDKCQRCSQPLTPDAATVMREYQDIGTANDSSFVKPDGHWVRFNMNRSGTKEVWCDHKLKQFYTVYSD